MARKAARKSITGLADGAQSEPSNSASSILLNNAAPDTSALDGAQREALLQQKQLELAQALDRHDDHVCGMSSRDALYSRGEIL